MSERTLGGDGELNLPYEPTGDPIDIIEEGVVICGGLVVRAAVGEHPATKQPHPVLLFAFHLPGGEVLPDLALVVEPGELVALKDVIAGCIDGAIDAAVDATAEPDPDFKYPAGLPKTEPGVEGLGFPPVVQPEEEPE